ADGPGPYTREVTSAPASGSLSAINPDGTVTYSPNPGFSGIDRFSWRVGDGLDFSPEAEVAVSVGQQAPSGTWFPPPGETLASQNPVSPDAVGLSPTIVTELSSAITAGRWALWRDGHLVHVEGAFNAAGDIQSVRKSILAAVAGAGIERSLIPSLDQSLGDWNPELSGADATASWFHALAQTSAFDEPGLAPGALWAYSDANPLQLSRALARVWGRTDYTDGFGTVLADALFDAIGAQGWSSWPAADGARLSMDLEDLGRVGLLLASGGVWENRRLLPLWFVDAIGTKQTYGIPPNYDNANDGRTGLSASDFPESPYGLMTWVNTDRDLYPGSSPEWVVSLGAGGHYIVYNREFGIVLAVINGSFAPVAGNPPGWPTPVRAAIEVIEAGVAGANPLVQVDTTPPSAPGAPGATIIGQSVQLSWSAASDAESGIAQYAIYRGTAAGGAKALIAYATGFATAYVDRSAWPNTGYFYEIAAVNGAGLESAAAGEIAAVTGDDAPSAPVGVSAVGGSAEVLLDWTDNVEADLSGYRVLRSTSAGGPYSEIAGLLGSSTYSDASVSAGTTYYYAVQAEDEAGNGSALSSEVSAALVTGPSASSHWPLDEGSGTQAADTVGGNDGTVLGAVWGPGVAGSSLVFDGSDDYVSIADSPSLDFSSFGGASVALWARPGRLGAADEQTLYGHWNGSSAQRPLQILLGQDDRWQCRSNHSDGSVNSVSQARLDEWVHVACVWSPAGLTVYVDGVAEATDSAVQGQLDGNNGTHTIGAREKSGTLSQFFAGSLDEVRLYDRSLAAGEVFAVYSAVTPGGNLAPTVDAGVAATIRLPQDTVSLDGTVSDDGQPQPVLTTAWQVVSGPPGASFGDAASVDTTVSFVSAGEYVLELTADDTELSAS
ncbi:MAG: Ig-like domain-containing protein, partial [Proteobacteria bacterium]|nr:Ig-like domain-containing protein [Pseudomonadota bacterium]